MFILNYDNYFWLFVLPKKSVQSLTRPRIKQENTLFMQFKFAILCGNGRIWWKLNLMKVDKILQNFETLVFWQMVAGTHKPGSIWVWFVDNFPFVGRFWPFLAITGSLQFGPIREGTCLMPHSSCLMTSFLQSVLRGEPFFQPPSTASDCICVSNIGWGCRLMKIVLPNAWPALLQPPPPIISDQWVIRALWKMFR